MREAMFWEPAADGRVRCTLCPHLCTLPPGRTGACGVRVHQDGRLWTRVDRAVAAHALEPIEKKPLFHFHPGTKTWSLATCGCNLRCSYCQNWRLSQACKAPGNRLRGEAMEPEQIVAAALRARARTIAYTYTEPTVFYELALATAEGARHAGLGNVWVSNGYLAAAPLQRLSPWLDAINVDLKFPDDATYRRVTGARLQPVLDTIRRCPELGIWVEVTSLIVPGLNDQDEQIGAMAAHVAAITPDIPWHASAFFPAWRLKDRGPTPPQRLLRALALGRQAGLRYVYAGNVPVLGSENTHCPRCRAVVIERIGYTVVDRHLDAADACAACGTPIAGVGLSATAQS